MTSARWFTNGLWLSAASLAATPAAAQSMNAEAFHKRAAALQAKGPLAILERGEIDALMTEAKAAGERSKLRHAAAIKAGKRKRYCPPDDQDKIGADEFMTRLSAISRPQRRRIDMTEAMTRILAAKYPCKR